MKLILKEGQKLFFTSDTHYNHANICSATSQWTDPSKTRLFDSLAFMNDVIVASINAAVGQDDILFHLGDWSFGGFEQIELFRKRIWCNNVHIITGNHDHHIEKNREDVRDLFSSVHKYLELEVVRPAFMKTPPRTTHFVLMHFPIASWNNMAKGAIHLHGHVHFEPKHRLSPGKMLDVGMDGNNLQPYGFASIKEIMSKQPVKSLFPHDHHEVVENYTK